MFFFLKLILIFTIIIYRFDIGDIIAQEETSIDLHETQPELYKKLALLGSKLLLKTMEKLPEVLSSSVRQNEDGITYGI